MSLELLEELCTKVALNQEEINRRIAKYHNSHLNEKTFQPDDLVLRKVDVAAHHYILGKLISTWEGPYIIK